MPASYTWLGNPGTHKYSDDTQWVEELGTNEAPGDNPGEIVNFLGSAVSTVVVDETPVYFPHQWNVADPNITLIWASNEDFEVTNTAGASFNGLIMSGGTIDVLDTLHAGAVFGMNGATISGGQFNIGTVGEADIKTYVKAGVTTIGTLALSGSGAISVAAGGELDIGHQTENVGEGPEGSGVVYVDGGVLLVNGGSIGALSYLQNSTFGSGSFTQTAGTIAVTGAAAFSAGTGLESGSGLFQAGTFSIGINFAIDGGTLQALAGGQGVTIAAGTTLTMGTGSTTSTLDGTQGGVVNSGTIIGQGVVDGTISTAGSVIGSGGILDVTNNQVGNTFTVDSIAASEVKFEGTDTGGVVQFNANTVGAIGFGDAAALAGFTDTVDNMGVTSSTTSVNNDNFINVNSSVTVGDIKVVGGTGNEFNGSATQFILYTDKTDTTAIGTVTLGSAPASNVFVDWQPDSTANGGALGGTDVFLSNFVCYVEGTLIRTDRGDVAIEDLSAGDTVITLVDGREVPQAIKWMGVRKLDVGTHPHPHLAAPVRIRANAFGDGMPQRDLLVSPAHAIYVDGKLVPANLLINNMTIVQELNVRAIAYYHVELDQHAILLAEGLPAESYLDTGNRDFFSNAGVATTLHPEFHVNAGLKVWEEKGCAPLAIDAEVVAPIWHDLAARAETMGFVAPAFTTTQDADVYLEANGRRLRPVAVARGRHTFMLPAGTDGIVLHSRASTPADLEPIGGDRRQLGVAVRSMTLRTGDDHTTIPADHPALTQGWHTPEAGNGTIWRWTAGNATIPLAATAAPAMLDIEIGETGTYILARSDRAPQQRAA